MYSKFSVLRFYILNQLGCLEPKMLYPQQYLRLSKLETFDTYILLKQHLYSRFETRNVWYIFAETASVLKVRNFKEKFEIKGGMWSEHFDTFYIARFLWAKSYITWDFWLHLLILIEWRCSSLLLSYWVGIFNNAGSESF